MLAKKIAVPIVAAKKHVSRFHVWLHAGERKIRFKTLLTIGVFVSMTIGLLSPAWATHSALVAVVTNAIWIWD